jgi:4-amino-4-deoxy-L-arabinose transferase-like glycosyltransferase
MHAATWSRALRADAGLKVLGLACAYVLAWAGGLALTRRAPPLDSAEQLVWSYAMQGGYWKHPPLPSWLMHGLVQLFGPSVTLPFFAAYACVAVALVLMWRLGCEFMTPQRSALAMGLTSLVGYHNATAEAFNHNTVLLPCIAAMVLAFYLATRRGDRHLWGLAGLFAGLSLLVKYVAVFPIAALLVYFVLDGTQHTRRQVAGLLLAGAVAAALVAPHAAWLVANGFMPFHYAQAVTQPLSGVSDVLDDLGGFLLMLSIRCLPLLVAVAWLVRSGTRSGGETAALPARDRLFLCIAGVVPLVLLVGFALATHKSLLARWGSTNFLLAGWLALAWLGRRPLPAGRRAWKPIAAVAAVLWFATGIVAPFMGELRDARGRARFPGDVLAARSVATWEAETGTPLKVVICDVWLAGNVVAHTRPLAVMVDGEPLHAPWVTPDDVGACGALVLLDRTVGNSDAVARWLDLAPTRGEFTIPWGRSGSRGEPLRIEWGVLPPRSSEGCPL